MKRKQRKHKTGRRAKHAISALVPSKELRKVVKDAEGFCKYELTQGDTFDGPDGKVVISGCLDGVYFMEGALSR
jgi:hypothetical protein